MSVMTSFSPLNTGYQAFPFQAGAQMIPQAIGGMPSTFASFQAAPQVPLATTASLSAPVAMTNMAQPMAQMIPQGSIASVQPMAQVSPQGLIGEVIGREIGRIATSLLPFQATQQVPLATTPWVSNPVAMANMAQPTAQMIPQAVASVQPIAQIAPQGAIGEAICGVIGREIGNAFGQGELVGSLGRLAGSFLPFQAAQQVPLATTSLVNNPLAVANMAQPIAQMIPQAATASVQPIASVQPTAQVSPQGLIGEVIGREIGRIAGSLLPFQAAQQVPLATTPWVSNPLAVANMAQPTAQIIPQAVASVQPMAQIAPQGEIGEAICGVIGREIGNAFGQGELVGSLARLAGRFISPFQATQQMSTQCLASDWMVGANRFIPTAQNACMMF